MNVTKARKPPRETEAQFQAAVIELAQRCGWMCYHVPDSRRVTSPGFPDLVLVRDGHLIFAELKSERGKLHQDQLAWLLALTVCREPDVYLWKPSDWPQIEHVLL